MDMPSGSDARGEPADEELMYAITRCSRTLGVRSDEVRPRGGDITLDARLGGIVQTLGRELGCASLREHGVARL
eukprot:8323029-Alexandrium_andersonii.AAC.1